MNHFYKLLYKKSWSFCRKLEILNLIFEIQPTSLVLKCNGKCNGAWIMVFSHPGTFGGTLIVCSTCLDGFERAPITPRNQSACIVGEALKRLYCT